MVGLTIYEKKILYTAKTDVFCVYNLLLLSNDERSVTNLNTALLH